MLSMALALVTWALLELSAVAGIVDYSHLLRPRSQVQHLATKPMPNLYVTGTTYQDTAYTLGLRTQAIRFSYRTDQRGFRNKTSRDAATIYLLGDSFLVGALVPFEETIPHRLEQFLREPVMNISLLALGVQHARDLLLRQNVTVHGYL